LFLFFLWRFIMKATRIATFSAFAIATSAASMGAFAQSNSGDYDKFVPATASSNLTRAQVQAETVQAKRTQAAQGIAITESGQFGTAQTASENLTREAVRAQAGPGRSTQLLLDNRG
jgi:hypothetical protein